MKSAFEKMIEDFRKKDLQELLQTCMHADAKTAKKLPLRYRLIAVGFLAHLSLEQLEQKLTEHGCERLYARNPLEASLIFAFRRGLSYEEWSHLELLCEKLEEERGMGASWFQGASITCEELNSYVRENSVLDEGELRTRSITRNLREQIKKSSSEEEFLAFMERNWSQFCVVREKTRYYFCKYLSYYIEERIENYLVARRSRFGRAQAVMELGVLKSAAKLRKKQGDEASIREMLRQSAISCGNLYDAFNYFYFEYLSTDWLEALLECYGETVEQMTGEEVHTLASGIRAYEKGWENIPDRDVIIQKKEQLRERERQLDLEYALEPSGTGTSGRGYQKNRSGEKSVRNYIKGVTDIDRTSLICYLLFFGNHFTGHREREITRQRLDEILLECGYPMLRERDDFDEFVVQYLAADDPAGLLIECVSRYAMEEKNFYLYHMYQGAGSEDGRLRKMLERE